MRQNKVYFIGEYLLSFPGGAEKSIYEELKEFSKKYEVLCYTFEKGKAYNKTQDSIKIINRPFKFYINISRFSSFLINKEQIKKTVDQIDYKKGDKVIIQALIAPYIAEFLIKKKIPYAIYLRDELNLNEFHNYEQKSKRILKYIKDKIETPVIEIYKNKNKTAIRNANDVIVNSKFMAKLTKQKFGVDSKVVLPKIDKKIFSDKLIDKKEQEYITFIGVEKSIKGYDIAKEIAKKMPNQKFLFIGSKEDKVSKNIVYKTWTKNPVNFYKKSKIIIVPSRWLEAYGRVAAEAILLKIPVITSNQGGTSEANIKKEWIIDDFENIDIWIKKIKKILKEN